MRGQQTLQKEVHYFSTASITNAKNVMKVNVD